MSSIPSGRKIGILAGFGGFIAWLLFVEIIGLFILFFWLSITLFGDYFMYGYEGFYFGISLPIIAIIIIFAAQFYPIYRHMKKKALKPFQTSIAEYNELLSSYPDKLKCIKCGAKDNLKKDRYTWHFKRPQNVLGQQPGLVIPTTILGRIREDYDKASIIPLCVRCSPDFEKWASIVAQRRILRYISLVIFFISILLFFSSYVYYYIFIILVLSVVIRRVNKRYKHPEFLTDQYVKNEGVTGIIFRPENSSRWIHYKDWLEKKPDITSKEFEGERLCRNCGASLEVDSKFCTQCGWSLR
ncbi:MAG: zinc ribbon domain-containing protein [Promethearchaeota archaeon]